MIRLCPFGCGERLYPDGNHPNAEQAELDKHRRECVKLREPGAQIKVTAAVLESVKGPVASPRAARWSLFMAHALQGLLAAPADMRAEGVAFTALAASLADDALVEHDARFKS